MQNLTITDFEQPAFVNVDVTDLSVRSYENFSLVITRFNYAMTAEGKPLPPRSIRATIVLKKEKNEWKIASAQYTGIRHQQYSQDPVRIWPP